MPHFDTIKKKKIIPKIRISHSNRIYNQHIIQDSYLFRIIVKYNTDINVIQSYIENIVGVFIDINNSQLNLVKTNLF